LDFPPKAVQPLEEKMKDNGQQGSGRRLRGSASMTK